MSDKGLTEQQIHAAELLASGNSQAATARLIGVSNKSIQRWLKDEGFKSAVDGNVQEIKNCGDKKLTSNINLVMDKMIAIALNGKSEKNSLDACIQILNRVYGMPTNKIENVTDNKDTTNTDKTDINTLLDEVDNNVIVLDKAQ